MVQSVVYDPTTGQLSMSGGPDPVPVPQPGSAFGAGLRSGGDLFVKNLGGAAAALGQTFGSQGLQDFGTGVAQQYGQYARQAQRPDLEDSYGPAGLLYKGAQALPSLGAMLGGALVGGPLGARAGLGAAGGAFLGGALTSAPETAGGFMNTAMEQPGGAGPDAGARALGIGLPLGAAMAVAPPGVTSALEGLATKGLGERMLKGGLIAGGLMGPQSAVTTAVDQSFRDDPGSFVDRSKEIVRSALEGFAMGGIMGGAIGGLTGRRQAPPLDPKASNADIASVVDAEVKPTPAEPAAAAVSGEPVEGVAASTPPALPGPPERLGLPAPDPAVRKIEDYPAEQLQSLYDNITSKTKRTVDEDQAVAKIEAEMNRRNSIPDEAQPSLDLGGTPVGEQPVSRAVRQQQEAVAAQQQAFVDQVKDANSGKATQFSKRLESNPVSSPEEFAQRVYDEYDKKIPSLRKLGEKLGLVDDSGEKFTRQSVDDALQKAHLDNIANETNENGAKLRKLEAARDLIDTIEKQRAGSAEVQPFAQERGDTGDFGMPDLPPPIEPKLPLEVAHDLPLQGFANPQEMVRGLANNERARVTTKSPTNEGAVVDMLKTRDVSASAAPTLEHLGLLEDGKRVPLADAVSRAQEQFDAAATANDPVARGSARAQLEQLQKIKAVDDLRTAKDDTAAQINKTPIKKLYQQLETMRRQLPDDMVGTHSKIEEMQNKLVGADTFAKSVVPTRAAELIADINKALDVRAKGGKADLPLENAPVAPGEPTPTAAAREIPTPKTPPSNPELARVSTPETRTQMDTDIESLVARGASGKDLAAHIAENSSDPFMRQLAKRLGQLGIDAKIEYASPDGVSFEGMHALQPDQRVTGSYSRDLNRINIYDRSNLETTVMHEMVHAATAKAVDRGQASISMKRLFDRLQDAGGADFHGLKDMHEFVAETMTNPRFQEFLKTQPYKSGNVLTDMWTHFKNVVFKALGLDDRVRTAFDQAVDGGNKILDGSPVSRDGVGTVPDVERQTSGLMDELPRIATDMDALGEKAHEMGNEIAKGAKNIKVGLVEKIKRLWNDTSTSGSIVRRMYDEAMKAAGTAFLDAKHQRTVLFNQFARMNEPFRKSWDAAGAKGQSIIAELTEFDALNINPSKDLAGNPQVHDSPTAVADVARANELYRKLKQVAGDAGVKAYDDAVTTSRLYWYGHQISTMEKLGRAFAKDLGLKGFDEAMVDRFQPRDDLRDNLQAAHDWMKGEYDEKMGQFKGALGGKAQELSGLAAEIQSIEADGGKSANKRRQAETMYNKYAGLMDWVKKIDESTSRAEQVPNFHKGRYGDWGVSAHFNLVDGKLDPKAVAEVKRRIEAATGGKAELRVSGDNPKIFMRFEEQGVAQDMHAILSKAQEDGLLSSDKDKLVKYGSSDDSTAMQGTIPKHVMDLWEQVTNNDLYKDHTPEGAAAQEEAKRRFMSAYLDSVPDSAISNVLQKRAFVQGASGDVLRNMITRNNILAHGTVQTSIESKLNTAAGAMRARVEDAKGTMQPHQIDDLQRDFKSLLQYEHEAPKRFDDKWINMLRGVNHAYFLGFSPSYVLMQLIQPFQTALPELGKHFGYASALKHMAGTTGDVTKLMTTIIRSGGVNGVISRENLLAAGHNEKLVNTVMRAVNDGTIDMSGPVRELQSIQQATDQQYHNKLIKIANTLPMWSETASRLVALLAADRAFDANPSKARIPGYKFDAASATPAETAAAKAAFTRYFVQETMGRYGSGETPRILTNKGPLGALTPLAGTFMSYHLQMFEKLVHEMHGTWDQHLTPDERMQSRKYIAGHMVAMAALTGTMGLPFFNLISGLATKATNLATGRDDNDVASSYRSFLSDIFSPKVSDVIARGLPRAVGLSLDNLNEADMAPFTQLLVDRRKWSERLADMSSGVIGAPGSMIAGVLQGAGEMANGRWLEGAIQAAPTALKNPLKAYKLQTQGYQTSTNINEPIESGPGDVIAQLMGFKLNDSANYGEATHTRAQLIAARQIRSQSLTKNLLKAYEDGDAGDQEAAREAVMPFDRQHPSAPILPRLPGMLAQRQRQAGTAEALGLPVGSSPLDLGTNKLLRYLNN